MRLQKYYWTVNQVPANRSTACIIWCGGNTLQIIDMYDGTPPRWLWNSQSSLPLSSGGWFRSWHIQLWCTVQYSKKHKHPCDFSSQFSTVYRKENDNTKYQVIYKANTSCTSKVSIYIITSRRKTGKISEKYTRLSINPTLVRDNENVATSLAFEHERS